MGEKICNTTFLSNKIYNPFVNGIIFPASRNTKYLVPSYALINLTILQIVIHNGFEPNKFLY